MRKTLCASALVLTLCGSALAGDIGNPPLSPSPQGILQEQAADSWIGMGAPDSTADGISHDDNSGGLMQTALDLLSALPSLF